MKVFSFILSVVVFFASLYYFVLKIPHVDSLNDIIYVTLLVILMAICIIGIIVNWEIFNKRKKNSVILFISNSFSKKK
jgi:hypothetical protein